MLSRLMTPVYVTGLIAGEIVYWVGAALTREVWSCYLGIAILFLGPVVILLFHWIEVRQRGTRRRMQAQADRQFRSYILVLFTLTTLIAGIQIWGLALSRPLCWCAGFAMITMSGLLAVESRKYRKRK